MYAVTNGHMDDVPVDNVGAWETAFHQYMEANHPKVLENIGTTFEIDDETDKELVNAIGAFKQTVNL